MSTYECSNCEQLTPYEHICNVCMDKMINEMDEWHNQHGCHVCSDCAREIYQKTLNELIKAVESIGLPSYHEAYHGAKRDVLIMLKAALERGTIQSGLEPMNWWENG